jgi:thiamine-phosphate pyrophosphorylase
VAACVAAGVDWVQTRDRALEGGPLLAWNDRVAEGARRGGGAALVVNRRIDIALASGAAGVHLGFDAVPNEDARALLGDDALLGRSLHEPEAFAKSGLDYAHLAPIATPHSKPASRPALGCAAITAAARHGTPVIAQGGIDRSNARQAIDAGASGVAVTGAVLAADDPAAATRALREALDA